MEEAIIQATKVAIKPINPNSSRITRKQFLAGLGIAGLGVVGLTGLIIWETTNVQKSNLKKIQKKYSPSPDNTKSLENVVKAGESWTGEANQYNNGTSFTFKLQVDTIRHETFSGITRYPTFNDSIVSIFGFIWDDVRNAFEPSKWQSISDFYSGTRGQWIQFTETDLVRGDNTLVLNAQYFAFVREDGMVKGIWNLPDHDPSDPHPDGDYTLNKTVT